MIVPTAPVVPRDEYSGVSPIRAVANSVDQRGNPRRTGSVVASRVIRFHPFRNDPAYSGKVILSDVGEYLRGLQNYVLPVRTKSQMRNRIWRGPEERSRWS